MISVLIHKLGESGDRCVFCDKEINQPHPAKAGEYVGVTTSTVLGVENAYRIGDNNREPLCNGEPLSLIHI